MDSSARLVFAVSYVNDKGSRINRKLPVSLAVVHPLYQAVSSTLVCHHCQCQNYGPSFELQSLLCQLQCTVTCSSWGTLVLVAPAAVVVLVLLWDVRIKVKKARPAWRSALDCLFASSWDFRRRRRQASLVLRRLLVQTLITCSDARDALEIIMESS